MVDGTFRSVNRTNSFSDQAPIVHVPFFLRLFVVSCWPRKNTKDLLDLCRSRRNGGNRAPLLSMGDGDPERLP